MLILYKTRHKSDSLLPAIIPVQTVSEEQFWTASGKRGKKSPRKLQRLSVLRYTVLLGGVPTSLGKIVAHPFWSHTGEMDVCTVLQTGAQKSQSRKRGR